MVIIVIGYYDWLCNTIVVCSNDFRRLVYANEEIVDVRIIVGNLTLRKMDEMVNFS